MAKTKKWTKYLDLCALVLGIIAICTILLPAIVENSGDNPRAISGLGVVFGYSEKISSNVSWNYTAFSFMNLLPYLLLVGGVVLLILTLIGKSFKFVNLVVCCLFIVAGVFMFLTCTFVVQGSNVNGYLGGLDIENYKLAIGSILGGIFALLAGIASGLKLVK